MLHETSEYADDFKALAEMAEAFLRLVTALDEDGASDISVEQVVELGVRCMPRSEAGAVAVQEDGRLRTVAATSEVCAAIDRIRAETGQGPSLDVVETNDVVVSGHLGDDLRWPLFGRRVIDETSLTSVATYRLYLGARYRGALTYYSPWPYAFDDIAITTGAIFAAYASLALSHQVVLGGPVPGARAASVHTEIGVAIGMLMAGTDLTTQSAYQRLHAASRNLNVSLSQTARNIIDRRRVGPPPHS